VVRVTDGCPSCGGRVEREHDQERDELVRRCQDCGAEVTTLDTRGNDGDG
jgi:endogenous inhibitor of DNA gyrase (YacG/DUF329 family)